MSFDLTRRFHITIETDEPPLTQGTVSIAKGADGTYYVSAEGKENEEQLFADAKAVLNAIFNAVEVARRQHFQEEVHPKLTGGVCSCQVEFGNCACK